MSSVRYFYFWCERCPTRITVETEVPPAAPDGEPEYSFADYNGVGLAWARKPHEVTPTDDGLEVANLCPACGSRLHDLDDLLARSVVPYHDKPQSSEMHADWRAAVKS